MPEGDEDRTDPGFAHQSPAPPTPTADAAQGVPFRPREGRLPPRLVARPPPVADSPAAPLVPPSRPSIADRLERMRAERAAAFVAEAPPPEDDRTELLSRAELRRRRLEEEEADASEETRVIPRSPRAGPNDERAPGGAKK